jgi:hypothetical protein
VKLFPALHAIAFFLLISFVPNVALASTPEGVVLGGEGNLSPVLPGRSV